MPDIAKITECPDCASTNIVHGMMRDQVICRDCGLIFEEPAPMQVRKEVKVKQSRPKTKIKKTKAKKTKIKKTSKKVPKKKKTIKKKK